MIPCARSQGFPFTASRDARARLVEEGRRDRKICAIGLKVARPERRPAQHLNVDRPGHAGIIPCGLTDVTSWEGGRIRTSPRVVEHISAWRPSHFRFLHDEVNAMSTLPDPEGRKKAPAHRGQPQTPIEIGFVRPRRPAKTTRTCARPRTPRACTVCAG